MSAIYLQSFFTKPKGIPLSVARWQPKHYNYKSIPYLVPKKENGSDIKHVTPEEYLKEYCKTLKRNWSSIEKMISNLKNDDREFTLCCWCNKSRQKQYKKLFCHTILIGYLIEYLAPEIKVIYLEGRDNPVWSKEEFYNELNKLN